MPSQLAITLQQLFGLSVGFCARGLVVGMDEDAKVHEVSDVLDVLDFTATAAHQRSEFHDFLLLVRYFAVRSHGRVRFRSLIHSFI